MARTFYALSMLGQESRLRDAIYSAIHDGMDLNDEATLFEWLGRHGVDMRQFDTLYHSSAVDRKIAESRQLAASAGITGVPSLVVGGKYLVLGNLARGELLDRLVLKADGQ
jgi:thiol:disulfide interchange protein DsbA